MRRGLSDDRASKLALIQQLAARRKEKESGVRSNRPIIGLSDSDNDGDQYGSSSAGSASDSDHEIDLSAPPSTGRTLSRIRKQGEPKTQATRRPNFEASLDSAADDLASELGSLAIRPPSIPQQKPPSAPSSRPLVNSIAANPSISRSLLEPITQNTTKQSSNRQPSTSSSGNATTHGACTKSQKDNSTPPLLSPPAPSAPLDPRCMVLGDRREFRLSAELSSMLYPHQIEGITWLFGLWKVGAGGILADDMGLGKTMQTSAFVSGVLKNRLARRVLVLAPTTLIATWEKELKTCGLGSVTQQYYGTNAERSRALQKVVSSDSGGVLLTTYGMVQHNTEALAQHPQHDPDEGPLWDIIIMDEGHKLKNPKMQLRGRVEALPVRQRIILSGTPIQNNLMEMHALFDLVCPGLLGDAKSFRDTFERRITAGSDKHATVGERERGAATAKTLRSTVAPYMLRREKKDVFGDKNSSKSGQTQSSNAAGGLSGSDLTTGGAVASASTTAQTSSSLTNNSASENEASSGVLASNASSSGAGSAMGAVPGVMPRKNDFVVWLRLKPNQRALYEAFLNSDSVREVLNRTRSALASLTVLKKVCDHPALLSERAQEGIIAGAERAARRAQHGGGSSSEESSDDEEEGEDEIEDWDSDEESIKERKEKKKEKALTKQKKAQKEASNNRGFSSTSAASQRGVDTSGHSNGSKDLFGAWAGSGMEDRVLEDLHTMGLEASCKTVFVLSLLRSLVAEGHRTLVFSQSRVMLNILEAAVRAEGWPLCRIDGGVGAAERAARVATFQSRTDIPIFLLTSQVGGLGLTLTAADRVIVVDPAWNPSVDSQSVDRAYRIGQKRDVVVYRLISCGTVEDKIYRKQVFKGGLSRTGTEDGEQFRYFSAAELRDMFRLDPMEAVESATQKQLHALHAHQRQSTPELEAHLKFLQTLDGFAGVSDHDLLYSVKAAEGSGAPGMGSAAAGAPTGAAYQPGAGGFAPSPARRPRQGRPGGGAGGGGGGRGAGQEWSGGNDLSAMFGRALTLGGKDAPSYEASASAVAAAAGTAGGPSKPPPLGGAGESTGGGYIPPLRRLDSLQNQLVKQKSLLSNPVLVGGLADGGAKLLARASSLQQEIIALEAEIAEKTTSSPQAGVTTGDEGVLHGSQEVFRRSSTGEQQSAMPTGQQLLEQQGPSPSHQEIDFQLPDRAESSESSSIPKYVADNQHQQRQPAFLMQATELPPRPPRVSPQPSSSSPKIKASFGNLVDNNRAYEEGPVAGEGAAIEANGVPAAEEAGPTATGTHHGNFAGKDNNKTRKELKFKLFERAKALKAAELAGDSALAAGLRREVEKLNAAYQVAKGLRS